MNVKPRPIHLLFLMLSVLSFGVLGYMVGEGWPFVDALYMTVITITSVGFGEVRRLDATGKVFTIFLIGAGVATITLSVQVMVSKVVETNLLGDLRKRRLERKMRNTKDHIIICGYGRMGRQVAAGLKAHGKTFAIIDREVTIDADNDPRMMVFRGDATDEAVLIEAGIERAKTIVTVVGSDADNLFIIISSRGLNAKATIISRASDKKTEVKMVRAGADKVISPYEIGGRRIVSFVLEPFVSEFLDSITESENLELRLMEVRLESGAALKDRPLGDSGIREKSGAIILAVRTRDGALINNPDAKVVLREGDTLIGLGTMAQIEKLREIGGKETI